MPGSQDANDAIAPVLRPTPLINPALRRRPLHDPVASFGHPMGTELVGLGMEQARSLLRELVRTPVNFLLVGPTGAGKDQFARAFHRASSRCNRPFRVVNCAAIPELLFESQLFGCCKGAFTGAHTDRIGILEAAQGGFVLLNEITDAPLSVQAKLLQAIDERLVWRVGESTPRRIDVWIAAATNRTDLEDMCNQGLFRPDLYHRLAQVVVRMPPLCERAGDIPELLDHLVHRVSAEMGRGAISFSAEAKETLMNYTWPGNVRELENLVRSLTLTCEGFSIGVDSLPGNIRKKAAAAKRPRLMRDEIRRKLIEGKWNVTQTAALIGLSREHLHVLMRRYKLMRPATKTAQHSKRQRIVLGV